MNLLTNLYDGGRGENDGWQTVKHISFAQPKEKIDSEGNELPDTSFDVIYIKIEVYPSSLSQLSQIPEEPEFAGDEDDHHFQIFKTIQSYLSSNEYAIYGYEKSFSKISKHKGYN